MTYPYGTKGAPVVGNGLGGLPRRAVAGAAAAFTPRFLATTTLSTVLDRVAPLDASSFLWYANNTTLQMSYATNTQIIQRAGIGQSLVSDGQFLYDIAPAGSTIRRWGTDLLSFSVAKTYSSSSGGAMNPFLLGLGPDSLFFLSATGTNQVVKLDKNLTTVAWARSIVSSVGTTVLRGLLGTSDGGCIVTGYVHNDAGTNSDYGYAYIVKFSSTGVREWERVFQDSSNRFSIALDPSETDDAFYFRYAFDGGGSDGGIFEFLTRIDKSDLSITGCSYGGNSDYWGSGSIGLGFSQYALHPSKRFAVAIFGGGSGAKATLAVLTKASATDVMFNRVNYYDLNSSLPTVASARGQHTSIFNIGDNFVISGRLREEFTGANTKYFCGVFTFNDPSQLKIAGSDTETIDLSTHSSICLKPMLFNATRDSAPATTTKTVNISNTTITVTDAGTGTSTAATTVTIIDTITA